MLPATLVMGNNYQMAWQVEQAVPSGLASAALVKVMTMRGTPGVGQGSEVIPGEK